MRQKNTRHRSERGFTLIEMLVSITLFAIVMIVCVGALLSLVGANKKAQALESTINNLNISLDDMARNLREGTAYNGQVIVGGSNACNGNNTDGVATDCTGGSTAISFTNYNGQQWIYAYVPSAPNSICVTQTGTGGCIIRSENGGPFSSLTAPEVSITAMGFYVVGTKSGDTTQPRVIITINGSAGGGNVKDSTTFHVQATAVQRVLDL